jgi:hypothetical protein
VTQTSETTATSGAEADLTTAVSETADKPQITVLKGNATDEELAALITVLGSAGGGPADPGPRERNLWGHPVDKLRYPVFSWLRVTLVERTHMRR